MKQRANILLFEGRICWTDLVEVTASNLPDRYLVHICPQCRLGQAVPATSEEVNQWRLGLTPAPRQCPSCKNIDLVISECAERRSGRIS